MQNSDNYRGGKFETSASVNWVNNIPRGEGKGNITRQERIMWRGWDVLKNRQR